MVKIVCRKAEKPVLPLRTASVTSLFAALQTIGRTMPVVAA
jgi:hypothetical protein